MKVLKQSVAMVATLAEHARLLLVITRVEFAKKYAGSVIGGSWLVLQPALLLSVYLFVYMVVFKVRFPGFSEMDFVLFVFAGLVPFLGVIEALAGSALSIKANMHLVKNVMLPIELIPVRVVLVAVTGECVALLLVAALCGWNGALGPMVAALPIALFLQLTALLGLAWIVAALGVAMPDVSYFISLFMFLLMFISPIAFMPDMVPPAFQFVLSVNPVYYMLEIFRDCLISARTPSPRIWGTHAIMSLVLFVAGSAFFRSFKSVLVDAE